jgi:hypothetical protein
MPTQTTYLQDWSNHKAAWAAAKPMSCEYPRARATRREISGEISAPLYRHQGVGVYRNLVKALPWYTTVARPLAAPAFDGWFLKFSGANNYHVPPCDDNFDPPLCSAHYHDRDQTPGHPRGDGDCAEPCDCGGVPCGVWLSQDGGETFAPWRPSTPRPFLPGGLQRLQPRRVRHNGPGVPRAARCKRRRRRRARRPRWLAPA